MEPLLACLLVDERDSQSRGDFSAALIWRDTPQGRQLAAVFPLCHTFFYLPNQAKFRCTYRAPQTRGGARPANVC